MKIVKKLVNVLAWCLGAVAVLLVLLNIGVTLRYADFFGNADGDFRIPGLTTGFVPQGFAYLQEKDCYLISGYMKDHSAARIYIRDAQGSVRFVSLKYQDGTAYDEHAGGVAVHDGFVYLPGKMGVDVLRLADILAGDASTIGKIPAEYDTDCVTFHDGYLLVGDFYHPGAYETPLGHHIITPAGDENKAVIAVYKADSAAQFGIDPQPVAAISVRDRVQGIGITEEGEIVLSTSYGLASSGLWFYQPDTRQQDTLTLQGREVPLYYLDSGNLTHSVEMPPMSEEIVCKDGRVYVLFESACTKYKFGKLIRGDRVYAYEK